MNHSPKIPPVDLYLTPDGCVVKVELAGVRPEDILVDLHGPDLRIQGSRKDLLAREGWRHYSMEIDYSRFDRRVPLPLRIEKPRVTCDFRDGMLLVRVSDSEKVGP